MSDPQALHTELLRRSDDWLDVVLSPQPFAAAVKAVLELHKPETYTPPARFELPDEIVCGGCWHSIGGRSPWPCSTVKVIASALGVVADG